MTKKTLLLILLFVLAIDLQASAATHMVPHEHVPNEIIVKFRRNIIDFIEKRMAESTTAGNLELFDSGHELNKKYRIRDAQSLFKNFKKNREEIKALLKKDKALLNTKEKHILTRLKRAPKGARVPELERIYKLRIELEQGQSLEEVVAAYNSNPDVEYAELNYIVSINLTPNDPLYPLQWPLNNIGQIYPESGQYNPPPGTPDCDIDAPEAWNIYTGYQDVIVAVVDTGVDYQHRELDDNMWVNTGEIAGNGIDDDNNGYVDDIYGYDFINNDSDPCDDRGHGTHCSGIIAAEGNNGLDITGICWIARIMALKFLDSDGYGSTSDAVAAFYYAVENGADVTSNSWGGGDYSETMKEAIDYAHSQGVIMVAAAGNSGGDYPEYPAYYENMISVAATNSNDERVYFSNYGDWVDIAAPGVDVLSLRADGTSIGTTYDDYTTIASGTSMACPHVAGACALLLSVNPLITCDEVYDILIETVDPIAPEVCKSGRLNLYNAVASAATSQGYISFDRGYYACSGVVSLLLIDFDLRGLDTQAVNVTTSGGDSETLLLTKDLYRPGIFTGTISTSPKHVKTEDGKLQVQHDQMITAFYEDANDGTGEPAVATDTAVVDCIGPVVSQVQMGFPGREPRIFFETDEPTTARVRCGLACGGPYNIEATSMCLTTSHIVKLMGLLPETQYFYIVEATDEAGNLTLEDNSGSCYSFITTSITDIYVPYQCLTIQEAIDNSWDGGMVLVADGTYTGPGNRDIDFLGRAIRVRSENGPENCIIDCNGTQAEPHRGFYFQSGEDACSVLEGFTITNGYAPGGEGGGIKSVGSSPSIDNCIIRGNWAKFGGGMDNSFEGSPTLTNCIFQDNTAELWGGGMENWVDCNATLINCSFTGNAAEDGGAMSNDQGSDVTVVDCTFNGNSAVETGGGGVGNFYCDPIYINCTFNHNTGEGMFNYSNSPTIVFCRFNENSSFGMKNADHSTPTVINCTFNGNGDSGIDNGLRCSPKVTNCMFSGNGAFGMRNWSSNTGTITNCTFIGNKGGIYNRFGGPVVTNCIFWDNSGAKEIQQIHNVERENGSVIINYSCVQGWTGELGGVGNSGDDPLFVDADGADDVYGTADDNPRLLDGSPCIDAGDNRAVPEDITDLDGDNDFTELLPWDFDGDLRFVNDPCVMDTGVIDPFNPQYPLVDMGAFEGVKQGFLVSTQSVVVPEGNSVTFTVALLRDPCETVEVSVAVESGDPSITVASGELLTFDSTNYFQGQPVTLAAAEDNDVLQDMTLIRISASGFIPAGVRAIEGETVPFPTVLYVDSRATGVNDGFSWANAFIDLQEALLLAENYSHQFGEVRVGEGIYKPTITGGDTEATFELINGVALRGGYAGFGTVDPNERDIVKYETILSGDLMDNDTNVAEPMDMYDDPCRAENICYIVTADWVDETTVLDGFIITGAGDDVSMAWEGAVYIWFAGPTLIDCTLLGNIETGLFSYAGHSEINNCKFIQNAGSFYGGGVGSTYSELILTNCTFSGNCSSYDGGGIDILYSKLYLNNCTFLDNWANKGGGMYNYMGDVNINNCIFSGNKCSEDGGGAYFKYGSQSLTGCIFSGNSTPNYGGGIFNLEKTTKLTNCTFYGNTAETGGGMYLRYWSTLNNCIFWGNQDNGGINESAQIDGLEGPIINYSCIQGWTGDLGGTGNMGAEPLFVDADGADNVIGTHDNNLRLLGGSPCLDAGDNSVVDVATDLNGNPRIINGTVDMGAYEGPYQGFLLSTESVVVLEGQTATFTVALAIDPQGEIEAAVIHQSGDTDITVQSGASLTFNSSNYSVPQTVTLAAAEDEDGFCGKALIWISADGLATVGVSATEFDDDASDVLYVDSDAPGADTGVSWKNAFRSLQDALSTVPLLPQVKEIHVAQGTYNPDRGINQIRGDREATFRLMNGLAIRGGYAGFGQADPDGRDIKMYETILSGDLDGDDTEVAYPEDLLNEPTRSENSYHLVIGSETDTTAVLDGFTITGGNANNTSGSYPDYQNSGGGMYSSHSGSSSQRSHATVINCTFIANSAIEGAGGMYSGIGGPTIANCTFIGNYAKFGGGMYGSDSYATLINCAFSGNSAIVNGGGIAFGSHDSPTLINCTLSGNSAGTNCGGIWNSDSTGFSMTNCILWGNTDAGGMDESAQIGGLYSRVVNYSCIQGWTGGGTGNIDSDPCFVNTGIGSADFHLKSQAGRWDVANEIWVFDDVNSPCIDAGDPNSQWAAELWPNGKRINMGAFGGTPEASMSLLSIGNVADLNTSGSVDYADIRLLTDKWLCKEILLSEDLDRNGIVDFGDFAILADNWSWEE